MATVRGVSLPAAKRLVGAQRRSVRPGSNHSEAELSPSAAARAQFRVNVLGPARFEHRLLLDADGELDISAGEPSRGDPRPRH
jgi:hypothetical protein